MVEMNDVQFNYAKNSVFANLSLKLEAGNIYGLLGINGVGKSTLLKLLSGLLFPASGSIDVLGYQPAKRSPGLLSQIFMLSENPHLPEISDQLYISSLSSLYPNFDRDHLERLLTKFSVPKGRKLRNLSLGEQKKFHLAFGLACRPAILILDEPTNGLDIPSKGIFRSTVAEALADDRIFIVATHQVKDVEHLIDRLLILHNGDLVCDLGIHEASARLRFCETPRCPEPNADGLLYAEPSIGGYASVWKEPGTSDSRPDLEMLFKAAISQPREFIEFTRDE